MKKWFSVVVLVVFAACQKDIPPFTDSGTGTDGTDTSASIVGTWKFVSFSVNAQSTTEYTQDDSDIKAISYTNYITAHNTGFFMYNNDSTFSASDISYDLSSTTISYIYKNGVLTDSTEQPFSFPLDSSSTTGKYEVIGSDSIYYSAGYVLGYDNLQAMPSGGKFTLNNNILKITQHFYSDTTEQSGDIPYHLTNVVTAVTTLQKQ